jgi:parallel beta helix pectate lyase-like protein
MRIAAFNATPEEKKVADRECSGTSDQVVIQQVIDSNPVSVELSSGDFNFSGRLRIMKPLKSFSGQGRRTVIHRALPHKEQLLQAAGRATAGLTISDLAFDDKGAALHTPIAPDTATVMTYNTEDVRLERLYLSDIYRTGIFIANSDNVVVDSCITKDAKATLANPGPGGAGGVGIKMFSATNTDPNAIPSRNNVIRNCEISGCWRVGLWASGVAGVVYENNHVHDNHPQAAIDAGIEDGGQVALGSGCSMIDVVGNYVHGGSIGIEFDVINFGAPNGIPVQYAIIARNRIHDVNLCGILIVTDPASAQAQTNLIIESNVIKRSTLTSPPGWGSITITEKISDFVIRGNMIVEQKHPACLIRKGADRYVVSGNHFEAVGMTGNLSARSALQDDGIGAKSVVNNLLLVNGKVFT